MEIFVENVNKNLYGTEITLTISNFVPLEDWRWYDKKNLVF